MRHALRGSQVRIQPRYRSAILAGTGQANLSGGSIPAPVKGWDAASPLEDMDPAAAIVLDNWFPEPGYVRIRGGHESHATGMTSVVESLMTYNSISGTQKMFAAAGTSVFDATATGAVGAAAITSTGNARFQHCHQTTSGGNFLIIVNGSIAPRSFDGAAWATPAITGITAANAVHVNVHKRRVWFILINSSKAAYLPVDSIAGAATEFDLGPLMSKGGHLLAMGTWTFDSGWGPDDFAAFVTSRGQVIVYAGNDPSSANDWVLKGVYDIGRPIGRRCLTKVGGDLALISIDGVIPLSQAIIIDRGVARKATITGNIYRAMNEAARDSGDTFGWQLLSYPMGTAIILNVPITASVLAHQYVMNPLTGAWCRYTGQNAFCWELMGDRLFFGGLGGVVYEADVTGRDDGNLIVAELRTAFNYFKSRGINKSYRMIRALMTGNGQVIPTLAVNTDYSNLPEPVTTASSFAISGARWNQFNWNAANWSGGIVNLKDWIGVENEGYCASIWMKVAAQNEDEEAMIDLRLNSFDFLWQRAGPITVP